MSHFWTKMFPVLKSCSNLSPSLLRARFQQKAQDLPSHQGTHFKMCISSSAASQPLALCEARRNRKSVISKSDNCQARMALDLWSPLLPSSLVLSLSIVLYWALPRSWHQPVAKGKHKFIHQYRKCQEQLSESAGSIAFHKFIQSILSCKGWWPRPHALILYSSAHHRSHVHLMKSGPPLAPELAGLSKVSRSK